MDIDVDNDDIISIYTIEHIYISIHYIIYHTIDICETDQKINDTTFQHQIY